MKTFNWNDLYKLCNEENLFTCGTEEQYNKMFDANDNGSTLSELAAMIWICSEEVSLSDVKYMLKKLERRYTAYPQKNTSCAIGLRAERK